MTEDAIAAIEYEAFVFGRHLTGMPGRTRRSGGVLDQSAYTLLNVIQAGGPASIGELAAVTGLDTSTLNRQTAALMRAGYVDRIANPDGGIARQFRLSPFGVQVLSEERQASRSALENLLSEWDASDLTQLARLLGRLNSTIEHKSGRVWPRPNKPHATVE